METIFTPVITPIVKTPKFSPPLSSTSHHTHQNEANFESSAAMNLDNKIKVKTMNNTSGSNISRPTTKSASISPIDSSKASGGVGSSGITEVVKSSNTTTMTVIGTAVDVVSNQLWICPTCKQPDDSKPMIGCDSCDDWYHWYAI
jgi:hypothetical protein